MCHCRPRKHPVGRCPQPDLSQDHCHVSQVQSYEQICRTGPAFLAKAPPKPCHARQKTRLAYLAVGPTRWGLRSPNTTTWVLLEPLSEPPSNTIKDILRVIGSNKDPTTRWTRYLQATLC